MERAERNEIFQGIALLVIELQRRIIPPDCPRRKGVLFELNNYYNLVRQTQDEEPDFYSCHGKKQEKKLYEVCDNCGLYAENQ